jgi:ribosome recycling factor
MSTTTEVMASVEERMKKTIAQLEKDFHTVRTGRANPALLEKIEIEYYGAPSPLQAVANVSAPDGRSLLIAPYDKANLKEIEQAIHKSNLGLTPNNDGSVIRIMMPAPTEERRKEMVKIVKKYGEDARISIRNIRGDGKEELKKMKLPEDDMKRQEETLQKVTDKYVKEIDKHVHEKEAEVMEV